MTRLVSLRYLKDEILLAIETLVQSYFVFRHEASYAEYFYDFKRVKASGDNIPKKIKLLVVILTTLMPYLKGKFERIFNDI